MTHLFPIKRKEEARGQRSAVCRRAGKRPRWPPQVSETCWTWGVSTASPQAAWRLLSSETRLLIQFRLINFCHEYYATKYHSNVKPNYFLCQFFGIFICLKLNFIKWILQNIFSNYIYSLTPNHRLASIFFNSKWQPNVAQLSRDSQLSQYLAPPQQEIPWHKCKNIQAGKSKIRTIALRHSCWKHVHQVCLLLFGMSDTSSQSEAVLEEQWHVYWFCLQCVKGR